MVSNDFSQASTSTAATNNSSNTFGVSAAPQQPKGRQERRQAKKGKKVSLQEFYQETPDYFRPPEVKTFVS